VKAGSLQGHLTTHGLAELFATLTALPLKPRLLPTDVERIIRQSILACFTLIPLNADDYRDAMELTVQQNRCNGETRETPPHSHRLLDSQPHVFQVIR
jgi:hypothetical protein